MNAELLLAFIVLAAFVGVMTLIVTENIRFAKEEILQRLADKDKPKDK